MAIAWHYVVNWNRIRVMTRCLLEYLKKWSDKSWVMGLRVKEGMI